MSERSPAEEIAAGLWKRVRDVILVAERVDGFVFGPADTSEPVVGEADASAFARDFVLRAMRALADPLNFAIVEAATAEGGIVATDLAEQLGLPRLAVAERANDLLQAGLVGRALDEGTIHATTAGSVLAEMIRETTGALARNVERARTRKESGNGLPLL